MGIENEKRIVLPHLTRSALLVFLLSLSFLSSFLFSTLLFSAQPAYSQPSVCAWRGYAKLNYSGTLYDGNTSDVVTSLTGGAQATNGTIESSGYYMTNVPGTSGDNITLQVCGVSIAQGFLNWSCESPGYHIFNISINTTATGSACTYNCGCTSGYCVHSACRAASTYCGDSFCDSGETCSNCATDCGSCSVGGNTGGTGGAAGGGTTTTTVTTTGTTIPAPPVNETQSVARIENGTSATINISKEDELKIESIDVEVKNTVQNVQVTVKESSLPAGANVAIASDQGAVYKYLEITKTNIQDADISKVTIKFKVEKSWAVANGIDPSTIALQRLVGSSWTKLATSLVSQDSTYYYFEAISPGLSIFAIVGHKAATTTTTQIPTTTSTSIIPPIPATNVLLGMIAIFVVVAVALVVFYLRRRQNQNQP